MSVRTGQDALNWARGQSTNPSRNWYRLCQMFTRSTFNVASRYPTAETAYYNTQKKHTTWPPPRAVPVWWTNGRSGHVAVSAGDGKCWSTDFKRPGRVDLVDIQAITAGWHQSYRGWSEDINGVTVWSEPLPVVDAKNIARATKARDETPNSLLVKKATAAEVGQGLMSLNSGKLGLGFRRRYKLVQKKYLKSLGVPATDRGTNGVPGHGSLTWLGNRHGFDVK